MQPFSNRRNLLKGIGSATLALPWLESYGHANERLPNTSNGAVLCADRSGPSRFFPGEADHVIPKGNLGNVMSSLGEQDPNFSDRPLTELTPTMRPLQSIQDKISLITGMDRPFQAGTDVHAQCASCYLSSAKPYEIEGTAWPLDRTLDHLVADQIGDTTPFRTLEFSCNSHKDNKESIYFDNISWYGTGHLAPSIRDPGKMYRRLFSTGGNVQQQEITSLGSWDAKELNRDLSQTDRHKFQEYFESIRSIELQIKKLERMRSTLANVEMEEPPESHLPRGEYIRLMGDLLVVALQTGLTNVATFMVGPERWDTPISMNRCLINLEVTIRCHTIKPR